MICLAALLQVMLARADTASDVYETIGIEPAQVLTSTLSTTQVLPGSDRQIVSMLTYLTGKRQSSGAVNVRLDILGQRGGKLFAIFSRDYGAERESNVARGDLQLIDLDGDRVKEIIVSFDEHAEPQLTRRFAEVILHDGGGFRAAWQGPLSSEATQGAKTAREEFRRELDITATLRSRGTTLFINKQVLAIAGQTLPEPRVVQESFPLRPSQANRSAAIP